VLIIENRGFKSKRNIRICQKCGNLIKEVWDPETSRWICTICKTPTPKRKRHKDQSKEAKDERNCKYQQDFRKRWPKHMRKSDNKPGSGELGPHISKNNNEELDEEREREVTDNECKRSGIATPEQRMRIIRRSK
jgi:DNA-directed RNA polymerase subunit M/transcription elongation factor TFIIS